MIGWHSFVLFAAFIGSQAIADVQLDYSENVNTRLGPSRIVSGWEAELGQEPWQLSLRMSNNIGTVSACGGSVIHEEWAITAAHCTAQRVYIIVRAGLVNLTRPEYIYETNVWFNHPLYNDNIASVVQPHDISVLKLGKRVTFTDHLQPIRVQNSADMNKNYADQQIVASGYGLTWTQGTSPEVLNWVYLTGVSNFNCWVSYGFSTIIVDSTICASYYNVTSQSTCQGDSGGPLSIIESDGVRTLIGVASFVSGRGCHTEDPAGFIRPGHYHSWYNEVTGINFDWEWPALTTTAAPESSEEAESTTTVAPDSSEEAEATTTVAPESSEEVETPTTIAPTTIVVESPTTIAPESSEEDQTSTTVVESPTTVVVESPTTVVVESPTTVEWNHQL